MDGRWQSSINHPGTVDHGGGQAPEELFNTSVKLVDAAVKERKKGGRMVVRPGCGSVAR